MHQIYCLQNGIPEEQSEYSIHCIVMSRSQLYSGNTLNSSSAWQGQRMLKGEDV